MNSLTLLTITFVLGELPTTQLQATVCLDQELQMIEQDRIQACENNQWRTICIKDDDEWDIHTANVACRQLGYRDNGATFEKICKNRQGGPYLRIDTACTGTETSLTDCGDGLQRLDFNECQKNCNGGRRQHPTLTCQPADCADNEVRLVGGSNNREGRVEVCMNGRWGTVCNNNQEGIAGAVCSQLEFPSQGAQAVDRFGPGTAPIYICTVQDKIPLSCNQATNEPQCNHLMDLGVECATHQEIIQETIDDTISLRGVVGVLVVLLVILLIGWSLSCVVLVKRNSNTQKPTQLNPNSSKTSTDQQRSWVNPVYDTNMESLNYSSSGPTYELVDTNEGAGPTYSVLEQRDKNASNKIIDSKARTTPQDEEHDYHVLESGECEGVTGGGCDYEVPVSQQTHSRVMLCEEEYSTLNH